MSNFKEKTERYLSEFLKCKNDFVYFCSKYIFIELPGGDVHLKPYKKQSELIELLNREHYILVLKSRQIGISTIIQAYATWLIIFNDNAVIGIISKDGPEATSFARSIASMIDKLPVWMKPTGGAAGHGFRKRSEQSFILNNGSKCYAATVNPKAPSKTLRGKSITFLIIDEAAFIEHLDEAWTSMIPALSTNHMHAKKQGVPYGTLVLSTPNKTVGIGAWFYKKYKDSVSGDGILKNFVIHWKDIQELAGDPDWYRKQCELFDNDPKKIQQELELKFVATTGTFFDEQICRTLQDNAKQPIEKTRIFNGEIWKWADPEPGKFYLIGVDTATEFGADRSAITIWDFHTLDQMWEYQGKCEVQNFIKIVLFAVTAYPGLVIVERNSYGEQVCKSVRDSDFGHMLYKEKTGKDGGILKPGLGTTMKTRPLIIESLYTYITQYPESVKSERLALELIGLVDKGGKVQAETGSTDDLAFSAGLSFYVRKYDAPLVLSQPEEFNGDFSKIMNLNDDINVRHYGSPESDAGIVMKQLKDHTNQKIDGKQYIDMFSLIYSKK